MVYVLTSSSNSIYLHRLVPPKGTVVVEAEFPPHKHPPASPLSDVSVQKLLKGKGFILEEPRYTGRKKGRQKKEDRRRKTEDGRRKKEKTKEEGRGLLRRKKESTQTKRRSGREAEVHVHTGCNTTKQKKKESAIVSKQPINHLKTTH